MIAEAGQAAHALAVQLSPSPLGVRLHWLSGLGILIAGNMPLDDVKAKVAAYAAGLSHPSVCFTDETRFAAARRFKWWPSFSELAQFLDGEAAPLRERLRRLNRVSTMKAATEAPAPSSPDEVRPTWRKIPWTRLTAAERALFNADGRFERVRAVIGAGARR